MRNNVQRRTELWMTLRTNQRLTSPAGYVGGKCRIAPHIIKRLPSDRACYVEVFGGMGHVMTQKAPEANEVFNDIQSIVVTFWLVLRDHREPLIERVRGMPYSREEHDRILGWWDAGCPGPVTDIERAARWVYLLKTSFSSLVGNPYGYARKSNGKASGWVNLPGRIEAISERWRGVHIERLDFADIIPRYDDVGTVFYCDPPYVDCEEYYEASGFTHADHARLAGCLDAIQGRAIVSYYEHDLIDTLYPKGKWKRATIGTFKSACPLVRGGAQTRPRSTELLLMNFDARTGRRLDERGRSRSRRAARS